MSGHTSTAGEIKIDKRRISGAALILPPEVTTKFQDMKLRRKHKFITFKVGESSIEADTVGEKTGTLEQFKASLPYTDCRFAIYDHDFKSLDGRPQSKVYFVMWLPQAATAHSKMAYAAAKPLFDQKFQGTYSCQISTLEELDQALGLEEEEEDNEFGEDDF